MKTNRILAPLVIGLTFFTGFSGLVFEVTWQKYLANLLGSEARATSIVLALFLGGLSLGYHFFGALSRNLPARKLLSLTGWIEIGIGAWIILFPELYHFVWESFAVRASEGSLSFARDVFVCFLLIGPPTFLMGGTLPLLTKALSERLELASGIHSLLYGINTLGAFFGCVLAGFALVPNLGLPLSLFFTAPLNILVGVALIGLAKPLAVSAKGAQASSETTRWNASAWAKDGLRKIGSGPLLISFLSGFCSLSLQTVLIRWMGISVGASEYAFSIIVSLFILLLAIGAIQLKDRGIKANDLSRNQLQLFFGLVLIYLLAPAFGYVSHLVRASLSTIPENFYVFFTVLFLILFGFLWLALSRAGRTLPLLFGLSSQSQKKLEELGEYVGLIYGVNTLGCVLGALFGGYVLLYLFNLDRLLWITAALTFSSVALAIKTETKKWPLFKSPLQLTAAILLLFTLVTPWPKDWLVRGTFRLRGPTEATYSGIFDFYAFMSRNQKLLFYQDSPDLSVGVIELDRSNEHPDPKHPSHISRAIVVSGKVDGDTTGDYRTMAFTGHVPALLSPPKEESKKKAAVIGFGTGVTVGSLMLYPSIAQVDCLEISPAVQKTAPSFDFANHNASKNSKLHWLIGDAYRNLLQRKSVYDLVISEPSNPWVVGIERLYTQEFYTLVSKKLSADGIYAQWFHTYEVGSQPIRIVIATLRAVFPEVRVFQIERGDLLLLARKTPWTAAELGQSKNQFDNLSRNSTELATEWERLKTTHFSDFLAFEMPLHAFSPIDTPVHSLEFPKLSYVSGRNFFLGRDGSRELLGSFDSSVMIETSIEQSLLAIYGRSLSGSARDTLFCGDDLERMLNKWSQAPILCQRTHPLAFQKDPSFSPKETHILKSLLGLSSVNKATTQREALKAIHWFDRLDSSFQKIPLTRLLPLISICFDAPGDLNCQRQLGHALIGRGEFSQLRSILGRENGLSPALLKTKLDKELGLWSEVYELSTRH